MSDLLDSTLTLHDLADDLGVEASTLRRALIAIASRQLAAATTDAAALFVDPANSATSRQRIALAANGSAGDTVAVGFHPNQYGMIPESNTDGCHGWDYMVITTGDDDDGGVLVQIAGLLPDGRLYEDTLQGKGTIRIPQRTADTDLTFTVKNSSASAVSVTFTATMRRVKGETSAVGRAQLAERGIPVRKARLAMMAPAIEAQASVEQVASAVVETAAAPAGSPQKAAAAGALRAAAGGALRAKFADNVEGASLGKLADRALRFVKGSELGRIFDKPKGKKVSRESAMKGNKAGGATVISGDGAVVTYNADGTRTKTYGG